MSARRWLPLLCLLIAVAPWSGCHQRKESAPLPTVIRGIDGIQHPAPTFRVPHHRGSIALQAPWGLRRFVGTEGHVPTITDVDLGPVILSDDVDPARSAPLRRTHFFASLPLRC